MIDHLTLTRRPHPSNTGASHAKALDKIGRAAEASVNLLEKARLKGQKGDKGTGEEGEASAVGAAANASTSPTPIVAVSGNGTSSPTPPTAGAATDSGEWEGGGRVGGGNRADLWWSPLASMVLQVAEEQRRLAEGVMAQVRVGSVGVGLWWGSPWPAPSHRMEGSLSSTTPISAVGQPPDPPMQQLPPTPNIQVVERVVQLQERQAHVDKQLREEGLRLLKELQARKHSRAWAGAGAGDGRGKRQTPHPRAEWHELTHSRMRALSPTHTHRRHNKPQESTTAFEAVEAQVGRARAKKEAYVSKFGMQQTHASSQVG